MVSRSRPAGEGEGWPARVGVPLPRGRHGLSAEYVAAHQRARLLRAVCEVCAVSGYAEATVAEVVRAAGVSQRAFYRHFDGKEHCFAAAWRDAAAQLEATVLAAVACGESSADAGAADGVPAADAATADGAAAGSVPAADAASGAADAAASAPADWPRLAALALPALLRELAAHPSLARVLFVDVLFAGPRALRERERVLDRCRATLPAPASAPAPAPEAALGGVVETIYHAVLAGETARLPDLCPELLYCLLVSLVGHERALQASGTLA
jgi:AcrR family transcriptional regulator